VSSRPPLPRNVWILGFVSLLMDLSSEIYHALLPLFITVTLGLPVAMLGAIDGVAEATASFAKLASGRLSDRSAGKMDAGELSIRSAADDDNAAQVGAVGVTQRKAGDRDQPTVKAVGRIGRRPHDHVWDRHRGCAATRRCTASITRLWNRWVDSPSGIA